MNNLGLGMVLSQDKTTFYYGEYDKVKDILLEISKKDLESMITIRSMPDNNFTHKYINEIKKSYNENFVELKQHTMSMIT